MKTPEEIKKGLECCTNSIALCLDKAGCAYYYSHEPCMRTVPADALDYIKQLEAKLPKWISVEERLPEGEVLAANFAPRTYGYKEYIIGHVFAPKCTEPGGCYAENEHEVLYDVTHWMPLPEPPKEGEHD